MSFDEHLTTGSYRVKRASAITGDIRVPGDKSISHRAVMLASLACGQTVIHGFLESEDCIATLHSFEQMGISSHKQGDQLIIHGKGLAGLTPPNQMLDMGNSGTGIRLLLGILSGQEFPVVVTGDSSLRKRPMKRVTEPLQRMGASFIRLDQEAELPLRVEGGKLQGIQYQSTVASAQIKSAILLAGLFADGTTEVEEPALSRDHTERMMQTFGVSLNRTQLRCSIAGRQELRGGTSVMVPGDLSSAAFFIVAASCIPGSDLMIREVGINPTRTGILDVLKQMGARIYLHNKKYFGAEPVADIQVQYAPLKGIEVSGETVVRMIDEFPIFAVAAALADSSTLVTQAQELRVKESDRISAMAHELKKFGIQMNELVDGFSIEGGARLRGAECFSHGDHRVAMSLTVAGLCAEGETRVSGIGSISTSFPSFYELMNQVSCGKVESVA